MTARSVFHRHTAIAGIIALATLTISCGGGDDEPEATEAPAAAADTIDGGDVDVAPTEGDDGSDDAPAGTDAPEGTDAPTAAEPGGQAGGTGFIQIGDVRHDLVVESCVTLFGALAGSGYSVSEPENISLTFDFSPEDWQERDPSEGWTSSGSVRLDSEEPYQQWESGEDAVSLFNLPADIDPATIVLSGIDVSDDGTSVQGEGIFIDLVSLLTGSPVVPTNGTYAFACPA